MALRISWFDVVGKAIGARYPQKQVAAQIEALSATFREGRDDFDYGVPLRQAAYLWHLLPAHVCDLSRLLLDLGELWDRPSLKIVAIGAGPGTEVFAALDAASALAARQVLGVERLEVVRVDRVRKWDQSFGLLLPEALTQVGRRDASLGTAWTLEAPRRALVADLAQGPLPADVRKAVGEADLILIANLITEVGPRETEELPAGLAAGLTELFQAVRPGGEVVLVDRRGAPGAVERLDAACQLAEAEGAESRRPTGRDTRCTCALTRLTKQLYERVSFPHTKDADRPVLNCRTAWCRIRFPAEAGA